MADTKVSDLAALATPATADLLYIVDDPAGSPVGKYITADNLFKTPAVVTRRVSFAGAELANGAVSPAAGTLGDYPFYTYTIDDDSCVAAPVPTDWQAGTDLIVKVRWAVNEAYATASGEVNWQAEWSLTPTDSSEAIDAPTHTGSDTSGDVNIPATAKFQTVTTVETIAAANVAAGDTLGLKVSRITLVGGANPTAEPGILSIDVEYTAYKTGGVA